MFLKTGCWFQTMNDSSKPISTRYLQQSRLHSWKVQSNFASHHTLFDTTKRKQLARLKQKTLMRTKLCTNSQGNGSLWQMLACQHTACTWHMQLQLQVVLNTPWRLCDRCQSTGLVFCFYVKGELSALRQMMKLPNEPGLSPNNGLENAFLSDQSMASNPREGQAKRFGAKVCHFMLCDRCFWPLHGQ